MCCVTHEHTHISWIGRAWCCWPTIFSAKSSTHEIVTFSPEEFAYLEPGQDHTFVLNRQSVAVDFQSKSSSRWDCHRRPFSRNESSTLSLAAWFTFREWWSIGPGKDPKKRDDGFQLRLWNWASGRDRSIYGIVLLQRCAFVRFLFQSYVIGDWRSRVGSPEREIARIHWLKHFPSFTLSRDVNDVIVCWQQNCKLQIATICLILNSSIQIEVWTTTFHWV